jgi:ligand-binding sensor domain-containing protein
MVQAQRLEERSVHYRPGDWTSFPVTRFASCLSLGHENVYFGTTRGIARYDFYRKRWLEPVTVSDGLTNDRIYGIAYDFNTSYLWCVTGAGVSFRVPGSMEWRNIDFEDLEVRRITSLGIGDRNVWIEAGRRVMRSDPTSGIFLEATLREAFEDNTEWTGARATGPSLPDLFMEEGYLFFPQGYIQDLHLRQYPVTQARDDRFDNLWMAVWGLSACVADRKTWFADVLRYGPYVSLIRVIAWDEAGMWIGGEPEEDREGGITWWDMDRERWHYFEASLITALRSDRVTSIQADSKDVWFGTNEGLVRYDKAGDSWILWSVHDNLWDDRVTALALTGNFLWVGTERGLNRMRLDGLILEQIREGSLLHRRINCLESDGPDLWAGTDTGLFHYSGEGERWEATGGAPDILAQEVTTVSVWGDRVWVGTDDGLEFLDRKTGEWKGFPPAHYPTGGRIRKILADDLAVWVGTDQGLLKYVYEEDRWRRFTVEDGLLHDSVWWLLLDGDHLWVATERGLTRFYWNAPYRAD